MGGGALVGECASVCREIVRKERATEHARRREREEDALCVHGGEEGAGSAVSTMSMQY